MSWTARRLLAAALLFAGALAATDAEAGRQRGRDRAAIGASEDSSTSSGDAVLDTRPKPTAYWAINEQAGSATVASYDGLYQGDVQLLANVGNASLMPDGEGASLDVDGDAGTDTERILVPDNAALEIGGVWTVMFWYTAGTCGSAAAVYDKDDCSNAGGDRFLIYAVCGAGPDCVFHCYTHTGAVAQDRSFDSTNDITTAHYAFTHDGAGNLSMYVNGALHDTDTAGFQSVSASTAGVTIGHRGISCVEPGCPNERIQGVAVWIGTQLPAADINRIYQAGL